MPRERAKLTEKEERILIQAQLMGLSTGSMIKIGNRLRALEKEREEIARINEDCQDYAWQKTSNGWLVTTPQKHQVEFSNRNRSKSHWNYYSVEWDITVSKPGTRFKSRSQKAKNIMVSYDWKAKLCPEKSKELYSCIKYCNSNKHEWSGNV